MRPRGAWPVVVLVVALAVAGTAVGDTLAGPVPAATSEPTATTPLPTIADAPPGTVFVTRYGTSGDRAVGLVKRGETGDLLFNPSTDTLALRPGDTLVSRSGQFYRVTAPQELPGSAGAVGPGATLFRGERDQRAVGFPSSTLRGTDEAEGEPFDLDGPVPATQAPGWYVDPAAPELGVYVAEPQVTRVEVVSQIGRKVVPGGHVNSREFVVVRADVNFLAAERAQVKLVNASTDRIVTDGVLPRREAAVRFPERAALIRAVVPPGRATPEGPDGSVRSLANRRLRPETTIFLIHDLRPIRRPGRYEVVVGGDTHGDYGDLFETGVRETVALRVGPASVTESVPLEGGPLVPAPERPTLTSPRGSYVLGETVDVTGTAPTSGRAVAVYVRGPDETGWELVSPRFSWVFIEDDGAWSVPEIRLSTESFVVRGPGAYELGVVPVRGADRNGNSYGDQFLSSDAFDRGGGVAYPLTVTDGTTPTATPRRTPVPPSTTPTGPGTESPTPTAETTPTPTPVPTPAPTQSPAARPSPPGSVTTATPAPTSGGGAGLGLALGVLAVAFLALAGLARRGGGRRS